MRMTMTMAVMAIAAYTAMAGNDRAALTGNGSNGGMSIVSGNFKLSSATYTVEAWVRPTTIQNENPIMDQFVGGTSGDWSLVVYAQPNEKGRVALFTRGMTTDKGTNWLLSDTALTANRWTHVAVVVDGSTVKFYLNGTLDTTHTITAGGTIVPVASGTFRLGTENRNNGKSFQGNLLDCRVWNTARTAEEIAASRFVRLA